MPTNTISVMTEDEINSMGLSSIVGGESSDADNPMIDQLGAAGIAMQDREGRQIISYDQFQRLRNLGARLEGYSVRMSWPGSNKINTVQASKYHKWYGEGYRPWVEEVKRQRDSAFTSDYAHDVASQNATAFFCKDKYAECPRFFDNTRALKFHWKKDHGEDGSFTKDKE